MKNGHIDEQVNWSITTRVTRVTQAFESISALMSEVWVVLGRSTIRTLFINAQAATAQPQVNDNARVTLLDGAKQFQNL